jgi:hypothetical protein
MLVRGFRGPGLQGVEGVGAIFAESCEWPQMHFDSLR